MTALSPSEVLTAAAQHIREGDRRIDIALRGPLARWLDDGAEGDEYGEYNPYAVEFAQAVVSAQPRRRTPIQGSGYTPAELLGGES